jgi:hypothetical protein
MTQNGKYYYFYIGAVFGVGLSQIATMLDQLSVGKSLDGWRLIITIVAFVLVLLHTVTTRMVD